MSKTNSIYTVKNGGSLPKLTKLEQSILEFFQDNAFQSALKVGDTISEKMLKNKFSKYNDEKMTVNGKTLITALMAKRVTTVYASDVQNGDFKSDFIFQVFENKAHGNYSVNVLAVAELNNEYTEKELSVKEKTQKSLIEFLSNYVEKNGDGIKLELENNNDNKELLNGVIGMLESLKD